MDMRYAAATQRSCHPTVIAELRRDNGWDGTVNADQAVRILPEAGAKRAECRYSVK
jgi:hypothetical protein